MTAQQPQSQASFDALARNFYYGETLDGSRQTVVFLYYGMLVDNFITKEPDATFTNVIIPVAFNKTMQRCRLSRHHTKAALNTLSMLGYINKWQPSSHRTNIQFTDKAVALMYKASQPEVIEKELMQCVM